MIPFPPLITPAVDPKTGLVTPFWNAYFQALTNVVTELDLAAADVTPVPPPVPLPVPPSTSGSPFTNLGLFVHDTGPTYWLTWQPLGSYTDNRVLGVDVGNVNRVLTLVGNPTLGDWFNQSVKTTAAPAFAGLTVNGFPVTVTGPVTLGDWFNQPVKTTSSPAFAGLSVNGHPFTVTGNPTLADWFNQCVKTTCSPTFANLTVNGAFSTDSIVANSGNFGSLTVAGTALGDWFDQCVKTTCSPSFVAVTLNNGTNVAVNVTGRIVGNMTCEVGNAFVAQSQFGLTVTRVLGGVTCKFTGGILTA